VDLVAARAPSDSRLYESHYLTATDPAGGRALWLRHTSLHGKPSLWVTWFDPAPTALRLELDEPLSTTPWPSCSLATMTATSATGSLGDSSWDLAWEPLAPALPYLPASFLYDKPVPRSNGAAVVPHATITGRYDGTSLDGWHGVVGHNWGREHAEHWCWLHAVLPDGWLDVVLVRVRVGPVLTPWIAGGGIFVDGALRRTRPGRVRLEHDASTTRARIPTRSGHVDVEVTGEHWVEWDYASPSGRGRDVRNCSVANGVVTTDDGVRRVATGTVAVEHGRPS
jgi:hypothetical protein